MAPLGPPFPSDAWFAALVERAQADRTDLDRLGIADLRLGVEVVGEDGRATCYGLVFDGYDVTSVGATDEGVFAPEVVVAGPVAAWRDMVDAIEAGGRADTAHDLNALTLAGVPLEVRSDDAVGHDKFFRFMGTVQALFDAAGRPATTAVGA
jgi:hypothetical protein